MSPFSGAFPVHVGFLIASGIPNNELIPGVLILRPESGLVYFNMDHVRDTILDRVRVEAVSPKLVVLDLSSYTPGGHAQRTHAGELGR